MIKCIIRINIYSKRGMILKFEGYKYNFRLNVSHGLNSVNTKEHHHTIEVTLYIENRKKNFESYADVEKMVDIYLKSIQESI